MPGKLSALGMILLISPLCAALAAPITQFNQLVSFGDSLSDGGNAAIATLGAFPGANYATRNVPGVPFSVGYFTDGPGTNPGTSSPTGLWIDQLAGYLNITDPTPVLAPGGGTNYAVGSAESGTSSLQDVGNQVAAYIGSHTGNANTLYTIWSGANDIFDGKNPVTAADELYQSILALSADGAKYFLWLNVPGLGNTPLGRSNAMALNTLTSAFDSEWAVDLAALQARGIDVTGVDVDALFNQILNSPGSFGFTDVQDSAQGLTGVNPNNYLFWDGEHPTTAADALVAQLALNDLVAVPEPLSAGLALIGLFALFAARNKRRRRFNAGRAA